MIKLPWPPAKTSPNASRQGDYRGKARAAKKYKNECAWECKAQGVKPLGHSSVLVRITFHPPKNYRYDLDNALARAKQGLDAVAEAIGVDDADWQEVHLIRGDKVPGGCVVVEIKRVPCSP